MNNEHTKKFNSDLSELHEKSRKEIMRTIESYGLKSLSDLPGMSDTERAKWLFWNLHENLDEIRRLEPTLIAQVTGTQLTISDGPSMWTEKTGLEKRIALSCKWQVALIYAAYPNEEIYQIGDGWMEFFIDKTPPQHPALHPNQKGYLDSDNSLYPNQLFLYGWITEGVWEEIKSHLYSANPHCHTDLFLRDNFLFPVKTGFDFVTGPPGSIGITNMEFRVSSHVSERRMNRRNVFPQL